MDINKLVAIVTIIVTLSIASERLVEIIKGFLPKLSEEALEGPAEAWRKAKLSILAVLCGIFTAFLGSPILAGIFKNLFPDDSTCKFIGMGSSSPCGFDLSSGGILLVIALGMLASGGSSLWNSILEYVLKIKDLKKSEVRRSEALRTIEVERARIGLEAEKTKQVKPN